ncbi:Hypoxic response protein 1 [Phycisphaerae bacterium RAS1]|nr:Hypoxic response protein 1 [Phycisphaerae bacterium RAS1]
MNVLSYATREVVTVAPRDSLDKAIVLMEERGIHHLPVCLENRVVGMLSDRDVLLSTGWMLSAERASGEGVAPITVGPTRIEQIMARSVISLSNSAAAIDAARIFVDRKIGALPILHGSQLVGMVTDADLLRWLLDLGVGGNACDTLLGKPVSELMRARVMCVAPSDTIADVIDLFRQYRIRHVPVVVEQQLMGIISNRDVRRALGWSNVREMQADNEGRLIEPPHTAVEIMKPATYTATPQQPLREALKQLLEARVHSLPVNSDGRLVGILTHTDFLKAIVRDELL